MRQTKINAIYNTIVNKVKEYVDREKYLEISYPKYEKEELDNNILKILNKFPELLNIVEEDGTNIAFHIAEAQLLNSMKFLIKNKECITHQDINGNNVLMYAISNNKNDVIKELIHDKDIVLQQNNAGFNAVMLAIIKDEIAIAKDIINNAKNSKEPYLDEVTIQQDYKGRNLGIYLIINGHDELLKELPFIISNKLINQVDKVGKSMVRYAAELGMDEIVSGFIKCYSKVLNQEALDGKTVAMAILDANLQKSINKMFWYKEAFLTTNKNNETLGMYATRLKNQDVVRYAWQVQNEYDYKVEELRSVILKKMPEKFCLDLLSQEKQESVDLIL